MIEAPKARASRHQRRRVGWIWGGVSAPQPTRGYGERRELPERGPGGAPAAIAFSAYFRPQLERFR